MKVWDIQWPIECDADGVPHRIDPPVLVTFDQEGYAAFLELKERAAMVSAIPEARNVFVADMDMLARFYLEFPGSRMVAA